jgi:Tfp pilus assembly protein PilN
VKTKLNFSSRPFQNRTLPWALIGVVGAVSFIAFVLFITESRSTSEKTLKAQAELKTLKQKADAMNQRAQRIEDALTPQETKMLQSAHLLISRKRFLWSRLFVDLEASLPTEVKVSRIRIRDVAKSGPMSAAELDLTVVSRTPSDVTKMIHEMDRNGVFSAEITAQNPLPDDKDKGTEFVMRVIYKPRPAVPVQPAQESIASSATPSNL